ncbi:E7 [Gammapapillomavirus sp.]|uniref:Protein E7 n=1 Tax=Human papillomavirus TaxID=10566 RepID=A0A385PRR9_9PAPI|nr:E7 [Gammapapillomavirus sp.]ATQ38162.1 E7 [Gammapapillomavirus sp.]AYA94642.1 MAG: E7 protein [Human papillomavirus]
MIGDRPTVGDISLNLEELVLPDNLLCNESLSPDSEPEEEQDLYRIDTCCKLCNCRIRVVVFATGSAIALFEQLLFGQLSFLCPRCSRATSQHGRTS